MGKRKTVDLEFLVDTANQQLRGAHGKPEHRTGVIAMIEMALMEAGRYEGFSYLTRDQLLSPDNRPGIHKGPNGEMLPEDERFVDTDGTRRQYALSKK